MDPLSIFAWVYISFIAAVVSTDGFTFEYEKVCHEETLCKESDD